MNLKKENAEKIRKRLFDWGFDIYEENRSSWTKKDLIQFESTWSIIKKMVDQHRKQKAVLDYVTAWLDANIDEYSDIKFQNATERRHSIEKNALAHDAVDLKEKIKIALEPETAVEDIEDRYI